MPAYFGTKRVLLTNSIPSVSLPLDKVTGAAAAYSLRRLRAGYAGQAINVRRSSDNAAQDIGFNSAGDLDTAALLTFCGAGNGFVTTFYDQTTNGFNATQGTAGSQPRIVNAGVVDIANSKPTLVFDGLASNLTLSGSGLSILKNVGGACINLVCKSTNTGAIQYLAIFSISGSGSTQRFAIVKTTANGIQSAARALDTDTAAFTASFVDTQVLNVLTSNVNYATPLETFLVNGASIGTAASGITPPTTSNTASTVAKLGARGSSQDFLNGNISEAFIYPLALSTTSRQLLEANQKLYYGTP